MNPLTKDWLAFRIEALRRVVVKHQSEALRLELRHAAALLSRDSVTEAFCVVADVVRMLWKKRLGLTPQELTLLREIDDTYDAWRESHA